MWSWRRTRFEKFYCAMIETKSFRKLTFYAIGISCFIRSGNFDQDKFREVFYVNFFFTDFCRRNRKNFNRKRLRRRSGQGRAKGAETRHEWRCHFLVFSVADLFTLSWLIGTLSGVPQHPISRFDLSSSIK